MTFEFSDVDENAASQNNLVSSKNASAKAFSFGNIKEEDNEDDEEEVVLAAPKGKGKAKFDFGEIEEEN